MHNNGKGTINTINTMRSSLVSARPCWSSRMCSIHHYVVFGQTLFLIVGVSRAEEFRQRQSNWDFKQFKGDQEEQIFRTSDK